MTNTHQNSRQKKVTVLMFSTDVGILNDGSRVQQRMKDYGELFHEVHIILFSKKLTLPQGQADVVQIGRNVLVYATDSLNRWWYVYDALRIGKMVMGRLVQRHDRHELVISTQDPFETGWVGGQLAYKYHVGLQVQVHTDFLSPFFTYNSFLNKIRVRMAGRVLRQAQSIRVVSSRIKKSIVSFYKIPEEKITVLPVYTPRFVSGNSVDAPVLFPQFSTVILMVCRLAREKNISQALSAFSEVVKKHPKTGLVILGDGPERDVLETEVKKRALSEHVVFEGWCQDLAPYYASADIFLSTSLYEGYGMAMIEAASAGLPIVTTNVGIAGEVLIHEKNALICPVSGVESTKCSALALLRLIEDDGLRVQLGMEAKKAVILHSYKNKDEYLKKYQEAIVSAITPQL